MIGLLLILALIQVDEPYQRFSAAYATLDADRVAQMYTEDALMLPPGGDILQGRAAIRARGKVSFLKPSEIDWIEADGKHARLHAGRDTHVVRHTLKRLEQRLAQHGFVRVHRSAIVNVDRIKELEPWFHGEYVVILKDGTKLTSSAAHSQALHRIVDAI